MLRVCEIDSYSPFQINYSTVGTDNLFGKVDPRNKDNPNWFELTKKPVFHGNALKAYLHCEKVDPQPHQVGLAVIDDLVRVDYARIFAQIGLYAIDVVVEDIPDEILSSIGCRLKDFKSNLILDCKIDPLSPQDKKVPGVSNLSSSVNWTTPSGTLPIIFFAPYSPSYLANLGLKFGLAQVL